ncbi:unnamed protein product [Brassica napus]|uniref:(rape) hypothetical protein n=1 Tax=Brassica napus TaxID=3708 RepID=A0A816YMH4_BRANA|nr:unnamed protein product [Brassica napus]
MDSFFTGFFHSLGNFFGFPLDFLSGKYCSLVCPSPWDVLCYVENFCVAYLFLFFFYMLYKIGFWHCIIHSFCRLLWALVSCWFYILSYCYTFFCYDLLHTKRRRRRRNHRYTEGAYSDDGSFRYHRSRREVRKEERLRKSLRPRSHRVRVGVRKDHRSSDSGLSQHAGDVGQVHGIRVSRESKCARKGSKRRGRVHHGPRRA